jgi:hypothetical protein
MKLEIGDIIQVDGGRAIVTQIKGDKATIAALDDLKGRSSHAIKNGVELEIARNRLLERTGEAGVAEFQAARKTETKHQSKGQLKVEPGDRLCYEGAVCVVTEVTAKSCKIAHPDGRTFEDDRWLNEFFFRDCACHELVRLTAEERAENLKNFLALNQNQTTNMKTANTKTKEKKTTKTKPASGIEGRSEYVAELVAKGRSEEEAVKAIREKYPVTTNSYAKGLYTSRVKQNNKVKK